MSLRAGAGRAREDRPGPRARPARPRRGDHRLRARHAAQAALRGQAARGAAAGREDLVRPATAGRAPNRPILPEPAMADLRARMAAVAEEVERALDRMLPASARAAGAPARGHALCRAGRRQAPAARSWSSPAPTCSRAARARASASGAAVELIHGYSLVHDDLPAMDDALTRRGRPSCHRQFDEATADPGRRRPADAWRSRCWPSRRPIPIRRCAARWCGGLAAAAGAAGMCGGQMIDLRGRGQGARARAGAGAAAAQDRRADRLCLRGGRDPGRRVGGGARGRCAATPPISASRSRSRTTCST